MLICWLHAETCSAIWWRRHAEKQAEKECEMMRQIYEPALNTYYRVHNNSIYFMAVTADDKTISVSMLSKISPLFL